MSIPQNDIREIIACKIENGKIIGVHFRKISTSGSSNHYASLKELNNEQAKFASAKPTFKPLYTLKIKDTKTTHHSAFVYVEKFGEQYEMRSHDDKIPNALRNLPVQPPRVF